jgi:hypothetical protein
MSHEKNNYVRFVQKNDRLCKKDIQIAKYVKINTSHTDSVPGARLDGTSYKKEEKRK